MTAPIKSNGIDHDAYVRMANQLESAPELTDSDSVEIINTESQRPEVLELFKLGFRKGERTGWPSLDEFFSVRRGEFTVITGTPGHGKSSFLDNLMVNLGRRSNWKWAVFSAENYPIARHIASLSEIYTEKPFRLGARERMTPIELDLALKWLHGRFTFIQPREDSYNLNRIVRLASTIPEIDALVIDPWNELDHSRPKDRREDEYISIALSKLRWVARTASIHVFVVAHPGKYARQPGQPQPVVTLNDVKGASEWFAKADNGLSVWRNPLEEKSATEVHVQKIRFREVGRIGKVDLYYDRATGVLNDPNYKPLKDDYILFGREPGEEG